MNEMQVDGAAPLLGEANGTGGSGSSLADSHVHLDRYAPAQRSAMLRRAREAGVVELLTVGVDLASSADAVALAEAEAGVGAAVGVHPRRVRAAESIEPLRALARRPGVLAVGEVGLDAGAAASLAEQAGYFRACLALAAELDLALSLHVVGAHDLALAVLARQQPARAVVHYFQGDSALAQAYLRLGCAIAVGKPAARAQHGALRQAVATIPAERLLLETDTYPLAGRSTEPADLVEICRAVAGLRGDSFAALAATTTANYRRIFHNRR